jgi:hypothetical protein
MCIYIQNYANYLIEIDLSIYNSPINFIATVINASSGHYLNQSILVQFTILG